jgi:hypothetical protein
VPAAPRQEAAMKLLIAVLIILVMLGYALNRGLFVGSQIIRYEDTGASYLARECRYLFPTGVTTIRKGAWPQRTDAENEYCPLFLL